MRSRSRDTQLCAGVETWGEGLLKNCKPRPTPGTIGWVSNLQLWGPPQNQSPAMPGGKVTGKPSGKLVLQLLFSEALQLSKPGSPSIQSQDMTDLEQVTTVDRILQEITAVSRRLEGMDTAITSLTMGSTLMRLDLAGFQSRVTGLEHQMVTMEDHVHTVLDRDQELLFLSSKLTDLEDRSRRDNIRLFRFPEHAEGTDTSSFLHSVLPNLTKIAFDPPLELQRAHCLGPKRKDGTSKPRPIIACLLSLGQACQLLSAARAHGPFKMDCYKICIMADFSRETNDRRKGFLALRPRMRQLEVKFGLFVPARLWVTKNGVSKDFYDSEDLRLFLHSLQPQAMDTTTPDRPLRPPSDNRSTLPPSTNQEGPDQY
ncbi:hypothetical protein NDU88_003004 [Pleurodeles waltl]|uniref:Uncharacterized protein n=1 Tax=Pleurodeles waltl TaxID=8319 RepID=A0AAV7TPX5_PLEWA|nr:hypothetical protein NDU88_003004 [Pleurodeles waltl]